METGLGNVYGGGNNGAVGGNSEVKIVDEWRAKGLRFKEKVYQDAFEVLLKENNIEYEREKHIDLVFHGVKLEHDFFYDFLIEDKIGVELKAVSEITGEFESQIINYLHVSNHKLGLLLNFGATSLEYRWYPNEWHHRDSASIG